MFEKFEAIFFDIDGTLVDVFPAHIQSYRNAFKRVTGIDVQNKNFFPRLYPLGSDRTVWKKALELHGIKPTSRVIQQLQDARELGMEQLLETASGKNVLPGVLETLQKLRKSGKKLLAFSGNTRANGERILRKTKLARFFLQTFFSSDSESIVDKETLFRFALQKTGVSPAKSLAVGDTPEDMLAARKVGMNALAVSTGLHSFQELRRIGYGRVVKQLRAKPAKAK